MNKYTYSEVSRVTNQFCDASYDKHGSFSHACGALESMLALVIADMPRHKQAELIATLTRRTQEMKNDQSVAA